MNVDLYERIWMILAGVLIVAFAGTVVVTSVAQGVHPPSNVETIDPVMAMADPRFTNLGVHEREDGGVDVVGMARMFFFLPTEIRVPTDTPVTFRLTSPDVIHGFQVVGTNVNVMVIPGYVSTITSTFGEPGEYLVVCNEFCGPAHHAMAAKLIVEEAQ